MTQVNQNIYIFKNLLNNITSIPLDIQKIKKFNLLKLISLSTCKCIRNNFQDQMETMLLNLFIPVIMMEDLYYIQIVKLQIFIFSKHLIFVHRFNLENVKTISLNGMYGIILKFFPTDGSGSSQLIKIKFFSIFDKNEFLKEILPDQDNDTKKKFFKKKLILHLIKIKKLDYKSITAKEFSKLRESGHLFYTNIYEIYEKHEVRIKNDLKIVEIQFFLIMFLFLKLDTFENIYNYLFSSIYVLKYSKKNLKAMYSTNSSQLLKYRDSVTLEFAINLKNKDLNNKEKKITKSFKKELSLNVERSSSKMFSCSTFTDLRGSLDFLKEEEEDAEMDMKDYSKFIKRRHLNVMATTPKNIKTRSFSNFDKSIGVVPRTCSDSSQVSIRPNYDKICFNINTIKYFGKDPKIIEINKNSVINIYKKGKVTYNNKVLE